MGTTKVGILGIHILVASSIHRAEAFGSCKRASTFVVGDSYTRECLWMLLRLWMLLACFNLSQLYVASVGLVSSSSSSGTNALRVEAHALTCLRSTCSLPIVVDSLSGESWRHVTILCQLRSY